MRPFDSEARRADRPRSKAISHLIAVRACAVAFVHQFVHRFVILRKESYPLGLAVFFLQPGKCSHSCDRCRDRRSSDLTGYRVNMPPMIRYGTPVRVNEIGRRGCSRRFLVRFGLASAVLAAFPSAVSAATETPPDSDEVAIETFSASGRSTGLVHLPKVVKSDSEWLEQLTPEQFAVTRRAVTEKAYSGPYWNNHEDGLYRCICCNTAVFDSSTKFDSHTGWPSFYEPVSSYNVAKSEDRRFGMRRTAVACALCDAHLGHVFDDGPPPTGLRYCIDSVALLFVPRSVDRVTQGSLP